MKKRRIAAVLLSLTLLLGTPTLADEPIAETAETSVSDSTEGNGKSGAAIILLSGVFGALAVSTLIFRGIDRTKYL